MSSKEKQLLAAKQKLEKFQKARQPGSYSIHSAISSNIQQHGLSSAHSALTSRSTSALAFNASDRISPYSHQTHGSEEPYVGLHKLKASKSLVLTSTAHSTPSNTHGLRDDASLSSKPPRYGSPAISESSTDYRFRSPTPLMLNKEYSHSMTRLSPSPGSAIDISKELGRSLRSNTTASLNSPSDRNHEFEYRALKEDELALRKLNSALTNRIKDLEAELDAVKLNESEERVFQLESELSQVSSQRDDLMQQLESVQNELHSIRSNPPNDVESLQNQLVEYQLLIESLRSEANDAQQQIAELSSAKQLLENSAINSNDYNDANGGSEAEIYRLQAIIEEHESTEASLRWKIEDLEQKFNEKSTIEASSVTQQYGDDSSANLKELLAEIENLTGIVASKTEALEEVQKQLHALEKQSNEEVEALLGQISDLQAQLASAKSNNEGVSDDYGSMQTELQQALERITMLEAALQDKEGQFEAERQDWNQINESLLSALEASKETDAELRKQIVDLTEERESMQFSLDGLNIQLSQLGHQSAPVAELLHQQIEDLSNRNSFLESELQAIQDSVHNGDHSGDRNVIESLEYELSAVKMERDLLNETVKQLESHIEEHRSRPNSVIGEHADPNLQDTIERLQSELSSIQIENDQLKEACNGLQQDLDVARQKLDESHENQNVDQYELVHTMKLLTDQNSELKKSLQSKEIEILNATSVSQPSPAQHEEMEQLQQALHEKDALINELESRLNELNLNTNSAEEIAFLRQEKQDLEDHSNQLEAVIEENRQKFTSIVEQLQEEKQGLIDTDIQKQQKVEELESHISHLESQIDDLNHRLQSINAENEFKINSEDQEFVHTDATANRDELVAEIDALNDQCQKLRDDLQQAHELAAQWEQFATNSAEQAEAIQLGKQQEWEAERASLDAQIEELHNKLKAADDRFENLSQQNLELMNEYEELQLQSSSSRRDLEINSDSKYTELAEMHAALVTEVGSLRNIIVELQAEISTYQSAQYELQIENLKSEKDSRERQIEQMVAEFNEERQLQRLKFEEIEQQHHELEAELYSLRSNETKIYEELVAVRRMSQDATEQRSQLSVVQSELEAQLAVIGQKKEYSESVLAEKMDELANLQMKLEAQKHEYESLAHKTELELLSSRKKIEDLEAQLHELAEFRQSAESERDQLRHVLESKSGEVETALHDSQYYQEQTKTSQEQLYELHEQLKGIKDLLADERTSHESTQMSLQEAKSNLDELTRTLDERNSELSSYQNQQNRIEELQEELHVLHVGLEATKKHGEELVASLKAKSDEALDSQQQVEELKRSEEELSSLNVQMESIREENANLQSQVDAKIEELAKAVEQINQLAPLEEQLRITTHELEEARQIVNEWQVYAATLDTEKSEWTGTRQTLEQRIKNLEESNHVLESEIAEMKSHPTLFEENEIQREKLQQQVYDLENQLIETRESLTKDLRDARVSLNVKSEDVDRLQSDLDSSTQSLHELKEFQDNNFVLEERIAWLENELNISNQKIIEVQELSSRLDTTQSENTQLLEERKVLENTIGSLNSEIHALQNNCHHYEQQIAEYQNQLSASQNYSAELEQQIAKLQSETTDSYTNLRSLEDTLNAQIVSLEAQLDEERYNHKELESKARRKSALYEELLAEQGRLQEKLDELNVHIENLDMNHREKIDSLSNDNLARQQEFESNWSEMQRALDSEKESNYRLNNELQNIQSHLYSVQQENSELHSKVANMESRMMELQESHSQWSSQTSQKLDKSKQYIEDLLGQIEGLKKQNATLNENTEELVGSMKATSEEAQKMLDAAKVQNSELHKSSMLIEEKLSDAESNINSLERELESLRSRLNETEIAKENVSRMLDEAVEISNEKDQRCISLQEAVVGLKNEIESMRSHHKRDLESHQSHVASNTQLKERIEIAEKQLETEKALQQNLESQIRSLKASEEESNGRMSELQSRHGDLVAQLAQKDQMIESLRESIKSIGSSPKLSNRVSPAHDAEVTGLRAKIFKLEAELADRRHQFSPSSTIDALTKSKIQNSSQLVADKTYDAAKTMNHLIQLLSANADQANVSVPILETLSDQLSTLLEVTQTSQSAAQTILKEIQSVSDMKSGSTNYVRSPKHVSDLNNLLGSRNKMLEDHKKIVSEIEKHSVVIEQGIKNATASAANHNVSSSNAINLESLFEYFVTSIAEYQYVIHDVLNRVESLSQLISASGTISSPSSNKNISALLNGFSIIQDQQDVIQREVAVLTDILSRVSEPRSINVTGQQLHQITSEEYSVLQSKAEECEHFFNQLQNSLALVEENTAEINVLKEAIETLLAPKPLTGSMESGYKLLQRQIDELRKVWSHELAANSVLRNLLSKTQAESIHNHQESMQNSVRLREEFDELARLYELLQTEIHEMKNGDVATEIALQEAKKTFEKRLNVQIYEQKEQLAIQEEMHGKECSALNKLISSLESERDRLLQDLARVKTLIDSSSSEKSRELDNLKHKLSSSEAQIKSLEKQLLDSDLRLRNTGISVTEYESKLKKIELEKQAAISDMDIKLRESDLRIRKLESTLKEAEYNAHHAQSELNRKYHNHEADRHFGSQRSREDAEVHRKELANERAQMEMEFKQKQLDILTREKALLDEKLSLRNHAEDDVRQAVKAEERRVRDLMALNANELRAKYDATIEGLRSEKKQLETQIHDLESKLTDEQAVYEDRLVQLKEELQKSVAEKRTLETKLQRTEKVSRDQSGKLSEEHAKFERKLHQLENQYETELKDMDGQIEQLKQENSHMKSMSAQREQLWMNERSRLEGQLLRVQQDSMQLSQYLESEDSKGTIQALQSQKEKLEQLVKERNEQIGKFESRVEDLSAKLEERSQLLKTAQSLNETLDRVVTERSEELKTLQTRINQLLDQISTLQSNNAAASPTQDNEIAQLKRGLADKASELAAEQGKVKHLTETIDILQQSISKVSKSDEPNQMATALSEKVTELSAAHAEIQRLKNQISELSTKHNDSLKGLLDQKTAQLEAAEKQITKLEQKIDGLSQQIPSRDVDNKRIVDHERQMDDLRQKATEQIKFERNRAKRLAHKIEDLKLKNAELKRQVDVRNMPYPSNIGDAQQEIEALRFDLFTLKSTNGEIVAILRETLLNTIGPGAIDIPDFDSNRIRINISTLREQCGSLIREVIYMRALINRLILWRADLKYQKLYMTLKINDLQGSQKNTLTLLNGMGVILEHQDSKGNLTARRKFRRCVNAVIAVRRMALLAENWQIFLNDNEQDVFMDLSPNGQGSTSGPAFFLQSREFLDQQHAAYGEGGYRLASTGEIIDSDRLLQMEQELEEAKALRQAMEERLNEEMYERRAIELENERLLRAIQYDRDRSNYDARSSVSNSSPKKTKNTIPDPRWMSSVQ